MSSLLIVNAHLVTLDTDNRCFENGKLYIEDQRVVDAGDFPDDNLDNWAAMLEWRPAEQGTKGRTSKSKKKGAKQTQRKKAKEPENAEPPPPLPGVLLAGFDADYWHQRGGDGQHEANPDLLDIKDEVNALASLTAAWSVGPPLSANGPSSGSIGAVLSPT